MLERFPASRVSLAIGSRARPEAAADRRVGADLLKTPSSPVSTLLFFSHGFTRVWKGEEQPRCSECQRSGLALTLYLKPNSRAGPLAGMLMFRDVIS